LQREAEAHAAEDAKKREEIEARNMADNLAYTAERTLREQGDKVPSDLKEELDGKIAAVKSALSGSDIEQVNRAAQELSEAMQKVGAAVYGQAGAPPPPGEGEASAEEPGGGDEGTVEGEFREV
jgi:molecular chaperone DnaK